MFVTGPRIIRLDADTYSAFKFFMDLRGSTHTFVTENTLLSISVSKKSLLQGAEQPSRAG
jgi:hypothetical protein